MNILPAFIVFEGLDGAGTTSQAKLLNDSLKSLGYKTFLTFEPTDSLIGKTIRRILKKEESVTDRSLMLLYAADRENHLYNSENGIIKHLSKGEIVISDRYLYSSLAYQGAAVGYDEAKNLNEFPHPEILFFIDTPVEKCLERIDKRGEEKEIFEKRDFLEKTASYYEKALNDLDSSTLLIRLDGTKTIKEIASAALSITLDNIHL